MRRSERGRVAMAMLVAMCACSGNTGVTPSDAPVPPQSGLPPPLPGTPGGPGAPPGGAGGNLLSFGEVDLTRPAPAGAAPASAAARCAGCDVVVITLCSVRRDELGAYGNTAGLTPNLDNIAAAGMRFDSAYAASNFTLPSLTSLFTGQFPSTTGVMNWDRGIGQKVPILAEVLGFYGYSTGAFTIDAPSGFRPEFGLDRGFQRMLVSAPPFGTPDGRHADDAHKNGPTAGHNIAAWIGAQPADKPIFAAFHDRDAHYPYVVAEPSDPDPDGVLNALWEEGLDGGGKGHVITHDPVADAVHAAGAPGNVVWRKAYAEAVARMDAGLGEVMTAIDKRGRRNQTVLIVVADHGESLDEHDELLHGISYFDAVVHVPMLVNAPGVVPGSSSAALVSHVDLFPTIAELVGAVAPAGIDGVSIVPILAGGTDPVRATTLVEGGVMLDHPENLRGAAISPPWTLLIQPPATASTGGPPPPGVRPGQLETHLYDLTADPNQAHDVAEAHPDIVSAMRSRWEGFRAARAGQAVPMELRHDPAFIEMLQRTGYDFRAPAPAPGGAPPRQGPPTPAPSAPAPER